MTPLIRQNLTEFFRDQIRVAMQTLGVEGSEESEFYLVKLLEGFAHSRPDPFERPLALEYLEAFHLNPVERAHRLRNVGDTALFISGVFLESLHRKLVTAEYYMQLGRAAYAQLVQVGGRGYARREPVFSELEARFVDWVRVLSEIGLQQWARGDSDILRIYTRWLYTRSQHDAEWLQRKGLLPFAPRKTALH